MIFLRQSAYFESTLKVSVNTKNLVDWRNLFNFAIADRLAEAPVRGKSGGESVVARLV